MKGSYKGGYMGKTLMVDLSSGKIKGADLPSDDVLRNYIGCWGLGLRYLYDLLPPGYTASDPENPLVFMTAPLTGLNFLGATNITLATKNFDTGFTVGRSHTHARFGILTKAAGYDGFIITGKSDKPVYLWIHDGKAELRDASHLWGKTDTHETEDVIQKELGSSKISVAAIGPCGENLVSGGAIMNDKNHGFCHSGGGSIMGSKKLKAIAVYGETPVPVADPDKLASLKKEWHGPRMKHDGHTGWALIHNQFLRKNEYRGRLKEAGFPGKNFRINQLVEFGLGWAQFKYTPKTCPGCPLGCGYDVEITTGPHKGYVATVSGGGEALEGAGSILEITEPGTIFYLTDVYDHLGIEGSVAGCTIAMALEAYEKGLITSKDTDGLELKWGDSKIAETLVRKMCAREGFGEVLAHGIKEAAELIGGDAPSYAVHVKGTGISLHDWRATWGVLLGQIVGSGAGWPAPGADLFGIQPDAGFPEKTNGLNPRIKPLEAKNTGIIKFLNDSTGLCMFATWGFIDVLPIIADTLNAATGWDYTPQELWEIGERVMHLERAFNVRHGLKPEDDWMVPDRLVSAPDGGPAKGISMKPYLEGMVKEYHRLMGWDPKTGKPFRSVLKRVGLDDVIKDLWG
jgi:aldehyde:ferredoxin oxidoreductase